MRKALNATLFGIGVLLVLIGILLALPGVIVLAPGALLMKYSSGKKIQLLDAEPKPERMKYHHD